MIVMVPLLHNHHNPVRINQIERMVSELKDVLYDVIPDVVYMYMYHNSCSAPHSREYKGDY